MSKIHPLIICGGKGTRLWPLSRSQSPKQFQRIAGSDSLTFFQAAVQRHRGLAYHEPTIVTGLHHRGTVTMQLREVQSGGRIICEPAGRNTGPAVLAAAHELMREDPDAVMVVIPADHVIEGPLTETITACLPAAQAGHILTFGVPPRYAESGFGYITDAGELDGFDGVHRVGGFIEKPPVEEAQSLIDAGGAYWASGLSMFSARAIIAEYEKFDPETAIAVAESVAQGYRDEGALLLDAECFLRAQSLPTEQAVFEKTDRIALAPLHVSWDDVGSWRAMYDISPRNGDGNVLQGDVIALNSTNTMVRSDSRLVSVVGLQDVVIVDTPDALLVARMDETQDVKKVVEELRAQHRAEADHHVETAPAMVEIPEQGDLEAIVRTDSLLETDRFHLGTAEIEVGRSIVLERGPASRQAIVVRGTVYAAGPAWSKTVTEGGRVYADSDGMVRIFNRGDAPAELLFVTIEHLAPVAEKLPMASNG